MGLVVRQRGRPGAGLDRSLAPLTCHRPARTERTNDLRVHPLAHEKRRGVEGLQCDVQIGEFVCSVTFTSHRAGQDDESDILVGRSPPANIIQNALLVHSITKIESHGDLAQQGIGREPLPTTGEGESARLVQSSSGSVRLGHPQLDAGRVVVSCPLDHRCDELPPDALAPRVRCDPHRYEFRACDIRGLDEGPHQANRLVAVDGEERRRSLTFKALTPNGLRSVLLFLQTRPKGEGRVCESADANVAYPFPVLARSKGNADPVQVLGRFDIRRE